MRGDELSSGLQNQIGGMRSNRGLCDLFNGIFVIIVIIIIIIIILHKMAVAVFVRLGTPRSSQTHNGEHK